MMKLIVAQKHMNLSKSIAVICCALLALFGNALSVKAAEVRSPIQSAHRLQSRVDCREGRS